METPALVRFADDVVALLRDGTSLTQPKQPGSSPRFDGFTVASYVLTETPPHGGERHADGDELLLVISGECVAVLDTTDGGTEEIPIRAGDAFVIPKDTWHRLVIDDPCHIVFVTPGPQMEHRGLRDV
jgi:mannose-6-phosphate isomerase-like protein (cupin superfamily)